MQTDNSLKKLGLLFRIVGWSCALFLLTLYFEGKLFERDNPNQEVEHRIENGIPTVTLKRNPMGHYVAKGYINNQPVVFLVDTGATNVSVPAHLAQRLGLAKGPSFYSETANGRVEVSATRLDTVELGAIKMSNVQASINPGMEMDEVLLGMSVLRKLEFTQRGNILTLRQH